MNEWQPSILASAGAGCRVSEIRVEKLRARGQQHKVIKKLSEVLTNVADSPKVRKKELNK